MSITVLIVDDSGFFRRRLADMINDCDGLKVVGVAENGREAIEKALSLKPNVITMDYEMPVMDGISAVRQIMQQQPTPILMFSSLTYEGARVTLDSLEAGAVDFLPKNFEQISKQSSVLKQTLAERIRQVAQVHLPGARSTSASPAGNAPVAAPLSKPTAPAAAPTPRPAKRKKPYELLAIGTSTGGPVALQTVLSALPANFSLPIVLVQHMPAAFTRAFAERLDRLCKITVREAGDGDSLRPGEALLAPGGKQLMITNGNRVRVLPGDDRLTYKPSVDVTFASAANVFADKVLAVVLTGMGADGCEGARILHQKGSTIWAQDKATSVIYGMPMAVAKAGLTDEILPLTQVAERLREVT